MFIVSIVFWAVFGLGGVIMFIIGVESRRYGFYVIPGSVLFVGGFVLGMLGWVSHELRNLRMQIAYPRPGVGGQAPAAGLPPRPPQPVGGPSSAPPVR